MATKVRDERFVVQNDDIVRRFRTLAQIIDDELPDGWGFGLFLYEFNQSGGCFWISNGQRADMIAMLKEWITKNEREGIDNGS